MSAEFDDVLTNQPVVIDNGSGTIKAGFAGQDHPKCFFPSFVGRPKHVRVMAGALEGDVFIGKRAQEFRGLLKIKYPMEHGIVTDWDDMERIWNWVYAEELGTLSEEGKQRSRRTNILRHIQRTSTLHIRSSRPFTASPYISFCDLDRIQQLSTPYHRYSSGRTTGIVLDSGDGVTHAVPVFEGFSMPHAIRRVDVAGRDVTDHLQLLLRKSGHNLHTTAEREIVRSIKEKCCYIAINPAKEEKDTLGQTEEFRLPDGNIVQLGAERFRAPELLFNPEIIGQEYAGVHQVVVDSINRVDLDLRKSLFSNIVLSGGSTLCRGSSLFPSLKALN
ncbi:hypothetical protein D9757_002901 [Collybiopsis confluens]|uniref:Actin n=1 Tax=Collybiopsis confluens TaxID=2823264 RepID=A0A8H5MDU7_9AGAR|nr:hypothetical protein D9757_002901 [Collybiopsis confluens]